MSTPTPQQQTAVARREGSLLLTAAAGSGKTTVLVERFVAAVVEDGLEPRQLLAITFTERAAGEMRERIRARLRELGRRAQARDTEDAYVLTIHGFCSRVLRANPIAAGLDPRFAVLDEPAAARLRGQAFSVALSELLAGPLAGPALDLVAAMRVDAAESTIAGIHDRLRSEGARCPRLPVVEQPPDPAATRTELTAASDALARELCGAVDAGPRVRAALERLEACATLLRARGPAVASPPELAALAITGGGAALSTPAAQRYCMALAAYAKVCADHAAIDQVPILDELLSLYGRAYARLKRRRGALDFDDLELEALALLSAEPALRRQWSERFKQVMVDEFQDTNPRQLELLALLDDDNVFTVGDQFQSIYRFRHADPGIFAERRAAMAERGAGASLTANFRSTAAIIDAVNAVFAPRFGESFERLVPGREDAAGGACVELLVTSSEGWEEVADDLLGNGSSTLPPGARWRHAEARLLAQRVCDLIEAGDAEAGEIAVLVRATSDLLIYERALEDLGLPTLASGAGGYWSRQQVRDVVAYLRVLVNPLDSEALYCALASPLGGSMAPDVLARIALAARTEPWTEIQLGEVGEGEDADALGKFRTRVEALRGDLAHLSIESLIERVVRETRYDLHVLSLPGGERRLANLHKLMRLARSFEAEEGRDLRGFVDQAVAHERAERRDPDAPVQDAEIDAVRLMSIHTAKGLEFPVVCLADLGRKPPMDRPPVVVGRAADGSRRLGLRLPGLDWQAPAEALHYEPVLASEREADAAEQDRVMYVAATRARERLILSGAIATSEWPEPSQGACPLSWLGPALVPGLVLDDARPDRVVEGSEGVPVRLVLSSPATLGRVLRTPRGRAVGAADEIGSSAGDRAETGGARAAPSAPAPRLALGHLSYTALSAHARCGYRFYVERVLRLPEEPGGSPARSRRAPAQLEAARLDPRVRGVVVHSLLEDLAFEDPSAPDVGDVIARALSIGHVVTAAEAGECAELVGAFARSPLCGRLAQARDVRREQSFSLELGPGRPLLSGVIDAIGAEAPGRLLVVDYKTDRVEEGPGELVLGPEYELQRAVYALAGLRSGATSVEVAHCFLERPQALVGACFGPGDTPALEAALAARVDTIAGGAFPVAAVPHAELCGGCPARRRLCSWDEEMTSREPREVIAAAATSA